MKVLRFSASLVALCAVLSTSVSDAQPGSWGDQTDGTFHNPVLNADYSDPDVVRVGSDFFMVASEFHFMGMQILHSKDLVNWTLIAQLYTRLDVDPRYDTFNGYGMGSWAPSIRYRNGRFWVFFSTPDEGIFMTTATDPAGPWAPLHCVRSVAGWIDPCPFWDDDGQAYLIHAYAKSRVGINSRLILHRMAPDGSALLDDGTEVFDGTISQPTIEGPKLYKRDGKYYIFAPAGGVAGGWQVVLRSNNIYGPYEDRVVLEQGSTAIPGPHQGGWVELESGESWFVHFSKTDALGRVVHLQPVSWVDGWPEMGTDFDHDGVGEPVTSAVKPNVGGMLPLTAPAADEDFASATLGLQWQWNHNPDDSRWSLSERPGYLRLRAGQASDFWHAANATQKMMGATGTVTTRLQTENMADGQKAGLCHLSDIYRWIGVEQAGTTRQIRVCIGGSYTNGPVLTGDAVWLRTTIDYDGSNRFYYSLDGTSFVSLGSSFTLRFGYWKGSKIGLFTWNPSASSGIADFDWFTYAYDGPKGWAPTADLLVQEAEWGTLSGAFAFASDAGASSGYCVEVPDIGAPTGEDSASYTFLVTVPGAYRVRTWVSSPDEDSNSFYVKIDGAPSGTGYLYDLPVSPSLFQSDYVSDRDGLDPVVAEFAAGPHRVVFHRLEDGARLDKVALELLWSTPTSARPETLVLYE
ncbi:family 43 glycosylhydrolase [Candidatus Sumerlaeota bacterium]|nr:family 43 glycosylhydrolase [Candidatus Sumerlaeota bacterium]